MYTYILLFTGKVKLDLLTLPFNLFCPTSIIRNLVSQSKILEENGTAFICEAVCYLTCLLETSPVEITKKVDHGKESQAWSLRSKGKGSRHVCLLG